MKKYYVKTHNITGKKYFGTTISDGLVTYYENGGLNGMYGKQQKILICPHCKKEGGNGAMVRWHFDNCKHKDNSNGI